MRISKLLSKKKIELFLITTNLQHHIVLLLLAFAVGVTDIAVDFRLFSSFVAHTICS